MKNAEISTEILYYADAETNTKYKKKDADVRFYIVLNAICNRFKLISI